LIDAFGWSWEYIDEEMTLDRLDAIQKRWDVIPPLSVSTAQIAAVLGVKHEAPRSKQQEQDPNELASALGASGFPSERPEWLTK